MGEGFGGVMAPNLPTEIWLKIFAIADEEERKELKTKFATVLAELVFRRCRRLGRQTRYCGNGSRRQQEKISDNYPRLTEWKKQRRPSQIMEYEYNATDVKREEAPPTQANKNLCFHPTD